MKYQFRVHQEKTGFWAECLDLPGCQTQAKTLSRLQKNAEEALNLFLDEPESSKVVFSLPQNHYTKKLDFFAHVEPRIALAFLIRKARLSRKWTQREAMNALGLEGSLFKYQRLENSETANPELETLVKLKKVFPELEIDEVLSA
jgi:antitoxin HicB